MKNKPWKFIQVIIVIFLILIVTPDILFAQNEPEWFLDLNDFQDNISAQWRASAFSVGLAIFSVLATLDLIILGIGLIFSDSNVDPINAIIKRLIFIAFLFGLLSLFWLLESFVIGFQDIAFTIYGDEWNLNEYKIVNTGIGFYNVAGLVLASNTGFWDALFGATLFAEIVLLLVVLGFVALAIQYAYLSLKVLFALTFSPLFLAFAPLKFTRPWAEGYISYIFRVSIQVFLFYMIFFFFWGLLIAAVQTVIDAGDFGYPTLISLLFIVYLSVFVLAKIPREMSTAITSNQNIDFGKLLNRVSEV